MSTGRIEVVRLPTGLRVHDSNVLVRGYLQVDLGVYHIEGRDHHLVLTVWGSELPKLAEWILKQRGHVRNFAGGALCVFREADAWSVPPVPEATTP